MRCLAARLSRSCIVTKRLKTRPMRIKNCTQGFEWYHFSMTLSDPSATFQGFNDSHSRAVSPRQLSFLSSKDGPLHDTLTRFRSPSQSTKRSRTGDQRKLPSGLTQLLQSTRGGTDHSRRLPRRLIKPLSGWSKGSREDGLHERLMSDARRVCGASLTAF